MKQYKTAKTRKLDRITRQQSAFRSFEDLLTAAGNYRPTIELSEIDRITLAREYDAEQERRGDPRRSYTYRNDGMARTQREIDEPLAYAEDEHRNPTTAGGCIKLYREDCARVLREAKANARGRGKPWHFVGRGVEVIALDETGERNDDLGGPEFLEAKELTIKGLKHTVEHWLKYGPSRDGHTLAAIHLAGGFDAYDSFSEYMAGRRDGYGEYSIWDDWAGQDIPVEMLVG